MKINQLRAVKVNIPRKQPTSKPRRPTWNRSAPRQLPINKYPEFSTLPSLMPGMGGGEVWVQVTAEDGTFGLGSCSFGELTAAVVDYVFSPLLEGRDCLAGEYLNDLMWRSVQRLGAAGHVAVAQSGVDLALWDLKGKLLGLPAYRLLGGPCRRTVPLYATGDDLDWAIELGFKHFKITNPAHYDMSTAGLNRVEEKVAHARELIGPDADLMLNAVMSYNVEFTVQLAERLKPYRMRWLEEPLVPVDLEGHIAIKAAVPWMPIATGEDHHGRHAFKQLVDHKAADVLQPDLKWCGGLTEAVKIYTIAEAAGLITIPHGGANSPYGQHFAMAFPESPIAEFWLGSDPGIPLEEVRPIPGMAMPKNGSLVPSDAPGFGMEIDPSWIEPWDHSPSAHRGARYKYRG
ncbi:MAG: hypothetical protein HY735_07680 [Verrucomicrobia bacterium]|nr:hypothetical protein [Verrucomicrobiota bacterium]